MVCKSSVPTLGRDKVRTLRLWVVGDGGEGQVLCSCAREEIMN